MGMNQDESSLQELAARLAREEQANADLRAKLANAQTPTPVSFSLNQPTGTAPSIPPPPIFITSSPPRQRRMPVWQLSLLILLALLISGTVGTLLGSQVLRTSPSSQQQSHSQQQNQPSPQITPAPLYQGAGYTITPKPGWQIQTPDSSTVTFTDPRFPASQYRDASHVGVIVNGLSPLQFEYGSSSQFRCHNTGGVAPTSTIDGKVWQQTQDNCSSLQEGGIASQIRIFFITNSPTGKVYAIYYVAAVDRLDDFSDGSFDAIVQSFKFR